MDDASFRTLAEVSPAGIWRTTADGQCTYVNPAWQQATGMHAGEWLGSGWANALHPDDAERVFEEFAAATSAGALFRGEWRWLRPDGTSPWVLSMGAPEYDGDGNIAAYVGINIDITETKEMARELEASRARAEHAALTKSRFLANMSHEIRTPMNGVIGFTDLLLASPLDETQRRHATLIADSGRAMMALLNDILDVSKIEAGQLVIEAVRIDLTRKLRHCLSLIEPNAVAKGLGLELHIAPDVPQFVESDPLRLRQILLNLLGNAVKFTDRGAITIAAEVAQSGHGERLRVAVRDTGQGIGADKLDVVFDAFSQADGTTARVHGGSGLGLSISRQLAQRMGGALSVESELGQGSTFTIDLPLVRVASRVTERPAASKPVWTRFAGQRVLIAEDHDINQQLIVAIARSVGLETTLAADGLEATMAVLDARAAGTPFDAVLMDVQMPRLDGLEATRRLRTAGVTAQELPIIALSANCYPDDIALCLAAGMQDHVGKPVEVANLVAALSKVWSSDAAAQPSNACATLEDLAERYGSQRDGVLAQIERCVNGTGPADWQSIAAELHKIAGTAAHFGQADLGTISRRLEHAIVSAERDEERVKAMRDALPEMRAAA
ncbi:PAS domain-containing hybrid sensor histidine kinase/response regulator [Tsuneonella dongtanensis]|uniref:PAS domain-containing hybrid sensor histidine kinase/response regulator n=1 Tax=Tsuneonella dongtanensis TaxID=692370 RepID=UPI0009444FE3|nr:PAS domain-containing hybrid sensor histidine kinase/response regulator [Tsuneonella dongtanensis]